MTELIPNAALAYAVLDQIDAHPLQWRQATWALKSDCGTSFCFAGWAVALTKRDLIWGDAGFGAEEATYVMDPRTPDGVQWLGDAAREALGIQDSIALFYGGNSREDLGRLVAEIFGPRPWVGVPWREADHRNHPSEQHNCRCVCDATTERGCLEHGETALGGTTTRPGGAA